MDRMTAILNAQIFRYNHVTLLADGSTTEGQHHTGLVPRSYVNSVEVPTGKTTIDAATGEPKPIVTTKSKYRTKFVEGPSIAAAKRFTRGKRCVVAQNSTDWVHMQVIVRQRAEAIREAKARAEAEEIAHDKQKQFEALQ